MIIKESVDVATMLIERYDDIQKLYYYMMKMMFRGVEEPDITIGELISTM